jgi:ligand-binding sensor domain-containing protein/two-component sensor histidine kinase
MPHRIYNTHNGLPQIQVRHIHQDQKGYIWVGTKGGFAKFNGEHFHHFLPNDHVYKIDEDKKGNIYIYCSSGLYRYNGAMMKQLVETDERLHVIIDEDQYILFNHSWVKHYKKDTLYNHITKEDLKFKSAIASVACDFKTDALYMTTNKADVIYKYSNGAIEEDFKSSDYNRIAIGNFNDGSICRSETNGHQYWIKTHKNNELLYYYSINNNIIDSLYIEKAPAENYILYHNYRYYKMDSIHHTYNEIKLPFIKAPYPVVLDKDNNLWAGSDNGLYQIWNGALKFYNRSFMNDFWTIIKGQDNKLYGGAYKQGLYQLNLANNTKKEIIAPGQYNGKETDYYYGASKDYEGLLYFPTHFGLVKYDYKKATKFDTGVSLMTMYDPFTNKILFGQQYGLGWIDSNENITTQLDESRKKVCSHPCSFAFTRDSIIWVGTGHSLCYYHRRKKQFIDITSLYPNAPTDGVIAMHKDAMNNIWMGTRYGLFLYKEKTNTFQTVNLQDVSGYITSITSTNNNLIIGTNREIIALQLDEYYNQQQVLTRLYNFRNGMVGQEIAQNGFVVDGKKVLIPSTTNTMELDVSKINFHSESYAVEITHINNQPLSNGLRVFRPGRDNNDLDIDYEMIGFGLPTTALYRYKLDKVDKEWSEWTSRKNVAYSNLASGTYTFKVATRPGGQSYENEPMVSEINIIISLPFYKEPYFYKLAFFILLFLGLVTGHIGWSRYHIKMKAITHERQVQYLEVATLQANLNPHFIFNLLASVQNLINQHKPEIANKYLIKFSRLIRAYMESSIKSSKGHLSESGNEISIKEEIDLLKMYIEFEQVKYREKKFDYNILVSNPELYNRTIPPMILQPLVENAIKHGLQPNKEFGQLNILFEGNGDVMVCDIEDNGIGREQSRENKKNSIKAYESRGLELINRRVDVLNQMGCNIRIEYQDPPTGGTVVRIFFGN